jgi:hypothetical protein
MAVQVQLRRGTTAQNNSFTGAVGEVTVDTTNSTLRVHDGATAGGTTVVTTGATQTLSNKTLSGSILSGNITGSASINVTGNVTGNYFLGNGSLLTGIDAASIQNGTSNVRVVSTNGIVSVAVGGTAVLSITAGGIINNQANGVGNIGNASGYFNTIFAKSTSAQYADLAEMYAADAHYQPGTVMRFGGDQDVTICEDADDTRVAGVISTNPSYIMNAVCSSGFPVAVALVGKVPTQVIGPVTKGDMMIAAGAGRAQACNQPRLGTVIGKSLEDFSGAHGVINIVVGRL